MKILHLDSGNEMRGGQWQVLRLHRGLLEAGEESLLLARAGSPLFNAAREQKLACEPIGALTLLKRSPDFHLVHAHDARSHSLAALFARAPLVVSRRVAFPPGKSGASRWKYEKPVRYIAVSCFVAGVLIDAGVDSHQVDIVYDGVDLPAEPARGEAIVTPWTLDAAKGMAIAEEGARKAGVPLISSKNLEADLPQARAMIYISQSEGLGSAILLAMAHGVPVIASRTGGIPELIVDKETGLLVDNTPDAVAAALGRLNPEFTAKMGAAAREVVREQFTVAHMVEGTLASYREALRD